VGNGEGMIVQRGYYQAANFHSERLRQAPLGHIVNVISEGYGAMPMYANELAPLDRWAVAAYIRSLQLSQHAPTTDAPSGVALTSLKQIATQEGLPGALAQQRWGIEGPKAPGVIALTVRKTESDASAKPREETAASQSPAEQEAATPATGDKSEAPKVASAPAGDMGAGKTVYSANCQMCHQASRAGNPPMIPSLIDIVSRVGNEHVHEVIVNGVPGGHPPMPAFGDRLSSTYIDNLIAYLRSK
jgi:mono/diheme cytochrome c family protein